MNDSATAVTTSENEGVSTTPSFWQKITRKVPANFVAGDNVTQPGSTAQPASEPATVEPVRKTRGKKSKVPEWTPEMAQASRQAGSELARLMIEFYDDLGQERMKKATAPLLPKDQAQFVAAISIEPKTIDLFASCGGQVSENLKINPYYMPIAVMAGVMLRQEIRVRREVAEVMKMIRQMHAEGMLPGQRKQASTPPPPIVSMPLNQPGASLKSNPSTPTPNSTRGIYETVKM